MSNSVLSSKTKKYFKLETMKSIILVIMSSLFLISCKTKESELAEYLQVMKVNYDIEGPKKISNEITVDSIDIEINTKPFKFINYTNFNSEIVNTLGLEHILKNYKSYLIKDIKELKDYNLFKENKLILEYNIYVDKKFSSKIILTSNEY